MIFRYFASEEYQRSNFFIPRIKSRMVKYPFPNPFFSVPSRKGSSPLVFNKEQREVKKGIYGEYNLPLSLSLSLLDPKKRKFLKKK